MALIMVVKIPKINEYLLRLIGQAHDFALADAILEQFWESRFSHRLELPTATREHPNSAFRHILQTV